MTRVVHLAGPRVHRGAEGPDGWGEWYAHDPACGIRWRGEGWPEPETSTRGEDVTCGRCRHPAWSPLQIARDEWPALRWERSPVGNIFGRSRDGSLVYATHGRAGWIAGRARGGDPAQRPTLRAALRALRRREEGA